MNSAGAAPVPPSAPSTTMKSGLMPLSCIALAMPNHSHGWPMASLKPVGLPPDSSRSRATNCSSSSGVENAECRAGETQSWPIGTPRVAEISALTLAPAARRRGPAWRPATASPRSSSPADRGRSREALLAEAAVVVAATEVARADLPDQVAAGLAVVRRDRAFAGVVVETAALRAGIQARIAAAESEPKLIAEMLNTLAEYGCADSGPIGCGNPARRSRQGPSNG
jgi:hypothetical protein